jgi:hypothetical protein
VVITAPELNPQQQGQCHAALLSHSGGMTGPGPPAREEAALGPSWSTTMMTIYSLGLFKILRNFNKFLTRNCIWQESARIPVLIIHHF